MKTQEEVETTMRALSLATDASQYDEILKNNNYTFSSIVSSYYTSVYAYSNYVINRTSGGSRIIEAPQAILRNIQRTLLFDMKKRFCLHPSATAVTGKSFIDNATPHVNAQHVFKTDILQFYPTATYEKVQKTIQEYFPEELDWLYKRIGLLFYKTFGHVDAHLPTGAPTSPFIGNLVLYPVDIKIEALAQREGATYTRYLDDITLSFRKDLDPVQMNDIKNEVCKILLSREWQPHPKKTRWIDPSHDRFTVTGVDIRREQKVTGKYIKQKVSPALERNVLAVLAGNLTFPKWIHARNQNDFKTFEDILPVFFSDSLPLLGYIKQVNKEQYQQQVDRLKYRLNHVGNLTTDIISFSNRMILKLTVFFGTYQYHSLVLEPTYPNNVKTFDEALLFCLQNVMKLHQLQNSSPRKTLDTTSNPTFEECKDELPF